jgi:DNA-binding PadR family transcriptional regulator
VKRKIELTAPLAFLILHELKKPATGTELAKKLGDRKGGGILTPGTIYPALKELHRKKLITFRTVGREKFWRLRKEGEAELELLYKDFSTLFKGLRHKVASARHTKNSKQSN